MIVSGKFNKNKYNSMKLVCIVICHVTSLDKLGENPTDFIN
jgi:hypothetical protein